MYSLGDGAKNANPRIFHIEGDPDHPVSRGSLCPKGAGLLDIVHSKNRLLYPEYRAPGSNEWVRISWEDARKRIARLLKDDRDKNFIARNFDTAEATVRAEGCGVCHGYLKVVSLERDPQAEAVADDLATLTLDDAVTVEGYQRTGFNPFALPG
ncbi:Protein FdhE [Cupriavidus laharis]|uniref:Protein FdhE n=1 Tax=Cupriavidus laharis TaxID=151654 RepID=A0ABN7ZHR2_9BURK|nr:Protein FdhE [Cupriavidus laharis]